MEFFEQVLNYSTSMPIIQRGISKVVFDKPKYLQAHHYMSQGELLNERLSKEGIELILLEDIEAFIAKHYPKVTTTLKLLGQLYGHIEKGKYHDFSKKEMSELYMDVILYFLPEYAFSSGNNKHLKVVTVSRNNFFSSLFLPANVDDDLLSAGAFIEGVAQSVEDQVFYPYFIIDGSTLRDVATKDSRSIGQFFTPGQPNGFRLVVSPQHYLWVKSHHLAKELSRIASQAITQYLDQPLMVRTTERQLLENHGNPSFFCKVSKTLEEIISDKDTRNTAICHKSIQLGPKKNNAFHCWPHGIFNFYLDLRFNLISILNKEYLLPDFKKAAQDCGVQYVEYSFHESPGNISQLTETSNVLLLLQPQIGFFSHNTAKMSCFITRVSPDVSKSIGAKYLMETSFRTDDPQPPCVPIIKRNDARRMAASADHMRELKRINEEVLGRYSPQTERFCYNYRPLQSQPLQSHTTPLPISPPHCNDYAMFAIVGGCAVVPIRALAPGLFLGMMSGFTGHIHRDAVTQHPVACGLACVASSAMGYCTMGLFGAGLSLGCWAMQSCLSRGPIIKSRVRSARMLQSLSVTPMLIGGIYHFLTAMAGFVLGNCCTSVVAGKVFKNHTGEGKKQRDAPPEHQRKRRRSVRKPAGLAASKVIEHREKDTASTHMFADNLHQEDSVVFQRRMIHEMLAPTAELPWSLPGIELLVMAYVQDMANRQERADYLEQRLAECEQATDGLLFAVSRFPDLYGLYLQTHQGNDIRRAKGLWTVLTPTSSQELLVLAGKMLIQHYLNNDDPERALTTLNDSRLTGEAVMRIIDDLSGAEILFRDGVPEKWASAYLARVSLKERKQKTANHVRHAVIKWLQQRVKKPELTDNLLHLAMDFRLADHPDEQTRVLTHRFRNALRDQAEIEIRYLPNIKSKVQRYLRARAVEIALNELQQ